MNGDDNKYLKNFKIRNLELLIAGTIDIHPNLLELAKTTPAFLDSLYSIVEELVEGTHAYDSYDAGYEKGMEDAIPDFNEIKDQCKHELLADMFPALTEMEYKLTALGDEYNALYRDFDNFLRLYRNK